jgi:hypothetical protein
MTVRRFSLPGNDRGRTCPVLSGGLEPPPGMRAVRDR